MMFCVWIIVVVFSVQSVIGKNCSGSRCGDCLVNQGCTWCKDKEFSFRRCGALLKIIGDGCKEIVKRKPHTIDIQENNDFSDGGNLVHNAVQLKPQRIKIKLIPNNALANVMIYYKIARNFPLDIYFLFDPSMNNLITSLIELTSDIANEISSLTTDFRFGFGTAKEKVSSSLLCQKPKYSQESCENLPTKCIKSYSFLHRHSLTSDVAAFKNTLNWTINQECGDNASNHTCDLDTVGGLINGLMQVMACGDRIGWRKKARRMVIYATDTNFHQAGDGRVAGILEPNDGLCHMDVTGRYIKTEMQDYPSVGQLIKKARENNINVIFIIGGVNSTNTKQAYYDGLAKQFPGGTRNAFSFSFDSNGLLSTILDSYRTLHRTVKLSTSRGPDELNLGIYTNCRTGGRVLDKTNLCENLGVNTSANFSLAFRSDLTFCPSKRSFNMTIFPEGLDDRVQIEVEHECECDCQREPEAKPNSSNCNQRGTYECGVCHCNEGWSGDSCECDERGAETEACGTEAGICSNAGICTCRRCVCFEGYSGDKCECNNHICPIQNGSLCGGRERGKCSCGKCACTAGYSGVICECPKSVETCKDQNGTICSDHGVCECGKCHCDEGFRGTMCEECHACPGSCEANYNCIECVSFKQGIYNGTMCKERCHYIKTVPLLDYEDTNLTEDYRHCILLDSFGCIINFNVYNASNNQTIQVKAMKRCPSRPINAIIIGLSISGAVLLAGFILVIIWKIHTLLYDNAEYAELEFEMKNPIWGKSDNLVYMKGSSITSTRNKRHDYSKLISPENQMNYEEIDLTEIDLDVDARSSEYYEIGIIRSSSNLDQLFTSVDVADKNQKGND